MLALERKDYPIFILSAVIRGISDVSVILAITSFIDPGIIGLGLSFWEMIFGACIFHVLSILFTKWNFEILKNSLTNKIASRLNPRMSSGRVSKFEVIGDETLSDINLELHRLLQNVFLPIHNLIIMCISILFVIVFLYLKMPMIIAYVLPIGLIVFLLGTITLYSIMKVNSLKQSQLNRSRLSASHNFIRYVNLMFIEKDIAREINKLKLIYRQFYAAFFANQLVIVSTKYILEIIMMCILAVISLYADPENLLGNSELIFAIVAALRLLPSVIQAMRSVSLMRSELKAFSLNRKRKQRDLHVDSFQAYELGKKIEENYEHGVATIIHGASGGGKTLTATSFALEKADLGFKILFVSADMPLPLGPTAPNPEIVELFTSVGLSDFVQEDVGNQEIHDKLSRGQLQRLNIAMRFNEQFDYVIFDEALNGLPSRVEAMVLLKMQRLFRSRNIAFIIITHNSDLIQSETAKGWCGYYEI